MKTNILADFHICISVPLNEQYSSWTSIEAGVPQATILGPLLFFIYINDFSNDLKTNVKLFADVTSFFSIVQNMNTSTVNLSNDMNKIRNWAIQWKISFNPDPSKQAQEIVFSRKLQNRNYNSVYFNHNSVQQVLSQKLLGMYVDTILNFQEHLNNALSKTNKTIGLFDFFPRQSLVQVYKAFVRPHLDYEDVIYDQSYNESFHQKMDGVDTI